MMRLRREPLLYFVLSFFGAAASVYAGDTQKTPRELVQYIEDAKRLGLKENDIRQNAVVAGWNKEMVSEALAIVKYMNEAAPPRVKNGSGPEAPRKPVVEPSGYRIGPGDVLQILVWKEPDASVPSVVV